MLVGDFIVNLPKETPVFWICRGLTDLANVISNITDVERDQIYITNHIIVTLEGGLVKYNLSNEFLVCCMCDMCCVCTVCECCVCVCVCCVIKKHLLTLIQQTHTDILVLSNAPKTLNFTPEAAPFAIQHSILPEPSCYTNSWLPPLISEHHMCSNRYKGRGKAYFRDQIHKDVYKMLLSTYLPGK